MAIEWQEDLVLGIPEIDEQHQEMFRRFAAFSEACQEEQGRELLMELLSFMQLYAQSHFATEERLMAECAYPGLDEQKLHHAQFKRDLEEFAEQVSAGGPTQEMALSVKGKLIRWLIQHIRELDRQMVEFVKAKMAEGRA
jgi:hemerythrin